MPAPTDRESTIAFSPGSGMTNMEFATIYLLGELICASPHFSDEKKLDPDLAQLLCQRAIKGAHIMFEELETDAGT